MREEEEKVLTYSPARTQVLHTHTLEPHTSQVMAHARSSKGKGLNTPYRKPDRTPAQPGNRPVLLSLPPTPVIWI